MFCVPLVRCHLSDFKPVACGKRLCLQAGSNYNSKQMTSKPIIVRFVLLLSFIYCTGTLLAQIYKDDLQEKEYVGYLFAYFKGNTVNSWNQNFRYRS